jgi:hypothetical protein
VKTEDGNAQWSYYKKKDPQTRPAIIDIREQQGIFETGLEEAPEDARKCGDFFLKKEDQILICIPRLLRFSLVQKNGQKLKVQCARSTS